MSEFEEDERQIKAKKMASQLKLFFLHLVAYLFLVILMLHNNYIMEDNAYANAINFVNIVVFIIWSVFIVIHGWRIYKARTVFKQQEDLKTTAVLEEDNEEDVTI